MTMTTFTQILKDLRKAGFKVVSKETTPGAHKAWLDHKTIKDTDWAGFMHAANKALRPFIISFTMEEIVGQNFRIEYQDELEYRNLFLAYYPKSRPRSLEYRMGIDC